MRKRVETSRHKEVFIQLEYNQKTFYSLTYLFPSVDRCRQE